MADLRRNLLLLSGANYYKTSPHTDIHHFLFSYSLQSIVQCTHYMLDWVLLRVVLCCFACHKKVQAQAPEKSDS